MFTDVRKRLLPSLIRDRFRRPVGARSKELRLPYDLTEARLVITKPVRLASRTTASPTGIWSATSSS
jgi:hypothetical protein